MGRLAGIVRQELGEVLQRAKLGFGDAFEDGELLRRIVDGAESAASRRECDGVVNSRTRKEDMENKLGCEVFEQHSGGQWM